MDVTECPVCLESLKNNPTITVDCCRQQFHTHCYVNAMAVAQTCPLCRRDQNVVIEVPQAPQQLVVVVESNRSRRAWLSLLTSLCLSAAFGFLVFNR